jgi:hypothetical protein
VKDSFSIAKEALRVSPYVADKLQEVNKFVLLPEEKEGGGVNTQLHDTAIFVNKALIGSEWPVPGKHCTIGSKRADVSTFYQVGELSIYLSIYLWEGRRGFVAALHVSVHLSDGAACFTMLRIVI